MQQGPHSQLKINGQWTFFPLPLLRANGGAVNSGRFHRCHYSTPRVSGRPRREIGCTVSFQGLSFWGFLQGSGPSAIQAIPHSCRLKGDLVSISLGKVWTRSTWRPCCLFLKGVNASRGTTPTQIQGDLPLCRLKRNGQKSVVVRTNQTCQRRCRVPQVCPLSSQGRWTVHPFRGCV